MVKSSNKSGRGKRHRVAKKSRSSRSNNTNQWSERPGKLKKHLKMQNRNKKKIRGHNITKKFNNKLSIRKLKQLSKRRPKKSQKLHLNKTENIFNLSMMKSLNKPAMDENKTENDKKHKNDKNENDASPNMDIDNNNKEKEKTEEKQDLILKVSNLPSNYEPGTMVDLPQQIKIRHWKSIQNTHGQKLVMFNPKRTQSWGHEMFEKKQHKQMKEIENKLKDEIRNDKQEQRRKKEQKDEMRKQNILRGTIVKPIRNMHKLKKFTKKQWRTVMKASVEIHNPRNKFRGNWVQREGF